jgi:hypothetical protein
MSPRRNWDSLNPSLASECAPPLRTRGGGAHSPAGEGLGKSQFRRLEKNLSTLHMLCGPAGVLGHRSKTTNYQNAHTWLK